MALSFSGCAAYKDLSLADYEKSEPFRRVEFMMKDHKVVPVEARQIAMVKSTNEDYIIYLKDGQILDIKKDQVASVRMSDQGKLNKISAVLAISVLTMAVAWIILMSVALGGK